MITLKGISLTKVVTYSSAYMPLNKQGLTLLYGRNLDSSEDVLKSNGSGKSLLFTSLAETLIDQHPLLDGRNVAKDSFRAGTRTAIEFDDYRLEKGLVGKVLKYDLLKRIKNKWVPTKVRTNDYVWQKMRDLFPVTNQEFFSLYYVDASRSSLLQRGTHTDRLNLFSQMLDLQQYDFILLEIKTRIKEIRTHDVKLGTVLDQIAVHEKDITDSVNQDTERLADLQIRQRKLSVKRSELSNIIQAATVYETHYPALKYLQKMWKKLEVPHHKADANWKNPDFVAEVIVSLVSGASLIRKQVKKLGELNTTSKKLEIQKQRLIENAEKSVLAGAQKQFSKKQLTDFLTASQCYDADIRDLELDLKASKKDLLEYPECDGKARVVMEKRMHAHFPHFENSEDYVKHALTETAITKTKLFDLTTELKEFKQAFVENKECPTCKSSISAKTIKSLMSGLEQAVSGAKQSINRLKELSNLASSFDQATRQEKCRTALLDNILECEQGKKRVRLLALSLPADSEKLALWIELLEKEKELGLDIAELTALVPKNSLNNLDVSELTEKLAVYVQALEKAEGLQRYHKALFKAIDAGVGDYDMNQLRETLSKLDQTLTGIMKEIPTLAQSVSVANSAMAKLRVLNNNRKDLEQELLDMPVLKALEDCYGQKGLKNLSIQRACNLIESNLNLYSSLLFSEPIVFELQADETHLNILATRVFNGETLTTDVRRLSGAESAAFNLLMPMAVLPLIPDNRRINIMCLDEPTSHMDQPAADLFTNKFLPQLLKLVPHVIVLSPVPLELDMEHDTWRVTREKGVSRLEQLKG